MARDKDKEKAQEDDMLTTRNDPDEPNDPDVEPDAPEPGSEKVDEQELMDEGKVTVDTEYLMEQIEARDEMIVNLQDRVVKLEKKKKASDAGNLAGAIKAMAGLALSPDGFAAFKQMVPYIFEE